MTTSTTANKIGVYNGVELPFPAGTTTAVMKSAFTAMYPELANGSFKEENGKTIFYVVAQNKSANKIGVYNGVELPFPEGTTTAVMKSAFTAMYPELANGSFKEEGGKTIFYVVAQNKSANKIGVYNGVELPFPAGTTTAVMKSAFTAMYPELANGSFKEENGKTIFYVVAQNKSAVSGPVKFGVYNGVELPFPAFTTTAVMKSAFTAMYPELANGSFKEENGKTIFYVVAQNKSANKIGVYNGVELPFPEGTTTAVMKSAFTAMYPELANGSFKEENGKTIFYVVAQNKSANKIGVYNGVELPFPAGTTTAVMKSAFTAMYPELANGSFKEEGGKTIFYVVAQNKSTKA